MEQISKKITGEITISPAILKAVQKEIKNVPDFKKELEKFLKKPITEFLEIALGGAINLGASDIHIEPEEEKTKIRIRIDGILQDIIFIDLKTYQMLLSRIKLLSGIKLNITDRPQDGRFSILMHANSARSPSAREMRMRPSESAIEIRTSTLPSEYGESIVLRILNPKSLIEIEALGLRKDLMEIFKAEIKRPNGMIIVTGPTGSGKTTTLYAILKRIQRPEIKIITIEDPIEYHLKGISQTQVAPEKKYDFASGLRSIVRQDPDVILVGEIRDLETVKIAIQAALTGHLVVTTLHTNDAAGTVARLTSLGAKPQNIGPAINVSIAQRLIRKVCQKCFKLEKPRPQDLIKIKKVLGGIPKNIKIPCVGTVDKIGGGVKIPKAMGCKDCNFTGFRGRIGIYEMFLVNAEMEKFILKNPSIAALREKAIKEGMVLMKQDGFIKVLEGITTIEEVERITG